ncbi:hypothetical protein NXX53_14235 [Bacteroides salyersiae]|nr:hypothetical protein [Bacteroides salyersiae]
MWGVAFISISGEGVKALVRIEVDTLEEYKTAYKVVGDEPLSSCGFYQRRCMFRFGAHLFGCV